MPNKTKDWLDDALDAVAADPVPVDFRRSLEERLQAEGLRGPAERAGAGRLLSFARPLLTAAAAALLLAIGYQLGAGGENHASTRVTPEGELAEADLVELYELREVIDAWDLAADADLDSGFAALAQENEAWVDELLDNPSSEDGE